MRKIIEHILTSFFTWYKHISWEKRGISVEIAGGKIEKKVNWKNTIYMN